MAEGPPTCVVCGVQNEAGARFCGNCGATLSSTCPSCGAANPPEGTFCTTCGSALGAAALPEDPGERKTITVLFADVAGFTSISERLDPEDVRTIMQRAFAVMEQEVHRFEGTISQYLGDGMLVLFGAPIAHEDHAQRAIRAALSIQEALGPVREELQGRGIEFLVRVGINTGPVVFGPVDSDLDRTLQATGDTMNTASRVQGLAPPGGVVVEASTYRLAEGYFEFSDLGEAEVKGKAQALHVYEALRPSRARSRVEVSVERGLAPLVGRERELEALMTAYEAARSGHGRVAFVSGEAGIGKSRLLYELRTRVQDGDPMWLTGRCISYGADIAYVPIVDLIKDACGVDEADGEDAISAKLDAAVAAVGGEPADLPYLRYLLSIDPGDHSVEEQDPAMRKARIFEAFGNVLRSAAERGPVVMTIEDLHWLDRPSTELLSVVADAIADQPVLLLLTFRPEWRQPFGDRPYYVQIPVAYLSEDEAETLAQETLGATHMPEALREAVARKAEGNPFFIEEVVRALTEANGDAATAAVPDTVQGVIMARLDRLPEDARQALQTASVIGREFTARLLERTAALGPAAEESLGQLRAAQLIFERSLYPELVFMFKHALTHDVAYESLLKERRRVLHGEVGDAILDLYADRLPELYEILAYHYEAAERWADAERYLTLAAEKSMSAFAIPEAAAFCDRALAALARTDAPEDPARLAAIHTIRAVAFEFLNRWDPACESYRAAAEAFAALGERAAEGGQLAGLANALLYAHRFDESLDASAAAMALGDVETQASAFITECFVHTVVGNIGFTLDRLSELEDRARAAPPAFRGLGLSSAAEYHHWLGDDARALALTEEAHQLAMDDESVQSLLWVLWDRGLMLGSVGRFEGSLTLLGEHTALCHRVNDAGFWTARSINTMGWVHTQAGAWAEGERLNRESLEWAHRLGDPEIVRNAGLNVADCLLATGDASGALRMLREIEDACAADSTPGAEWMKWRYIQHLWASSADALLATGRADEALAVADRCLEQAERTRSARYLVRGRQARAAALVALGHTEDALVDAEAAVATADAHAWPTLGWRTRLTLGDVMASAGRSDVAGAAYEAGAALIEEAAEGVTDDAVRAGLLGSPEAERLRAGTTS